MSQPNQRMLDTTARARIMAARFTYALEMLGRVQQCADERSADEKVHTSGISSPTERQAMRHYEARTKVEDLRDCVNDWINTTDLFGREIEGVLSWCALVLGITHDRPSLCGDGDKVRGYEGIALPWTPMRRDPENGWHDPTCRDIATRTGLCDRCTLRMDRWRQRKGLALVRPVGEAA